MSHATNAIYLYIGMASERNKTVDRVWPRTDSGFLGVPDKCDAMAAIIEAWEAVHMAAIECPGPFEYEVVEELGGWLYHHFDCTEQDFYSALVSFVAVWITADEERIRLWLENDKRLAGVEPSEGPTSVENAEG